MVFDGLDTLYARNTPTVLHIILKALNNRKHIYLINLKQEYSSMKARERAQREEEGMRHPDREETRGGYIRGHSVWGAA